MTAKEKLEKAQELVIAYKALGLNEDYTSEDFDCVRLFVESIFERHTIKTRES